MGRIKSTLVKRTGKKLLKEENVFNESFEDDKKILGNALPSKRIRNKIAGYIARLQKAKLFEIAQKSKKISDIETG